MRRPPGSPAFIQVSTSPRGRVFAITRLMASAAPTLHIEGDRLRVPASAWQLDGFRAWIRSQEFPSGVRASFLAGEVFIEMSPDSIESHNKVKTALTATLEQVARDEDLGEIYSDRALLCHTEVGLSTEPDLVFASWQTLEMGRLRLVPGARSGEFVELQGAPDLVVEVVSDSSERKDLEYLRAAYAQAAIAEYWIIDARRAELRFEILQLADGEYRSTSAAGPEQVSLVFGRRFVLERERNRVGRYRYRLLPR